MASDFVSTLVRDWEKAADLFEDRCKVIKLRISFVLSPLGGSLVKLEKPIRMGLALVLGSGKQSIPWIHLDDLMGIIEFGINKGLKGVYHANAGNTTMLEMTQLLAQKHKKKIWLPSVPGFLLRLVLGKLSSLVLEGIMANSDKIRNAGFEFKKGKIKEALN